MNRLCISLGVLVLMLIFVPFLHAQDEDDEDDIEGPKNCRNVDFSAFCIIDNHFKTIVEERLEWNYYPQFQEIVDDVFSDAPWVDDDEDKGFTPDQVEGIAIVQPDAGNNGGGGGVSSGVSGSSPAPSLSSTPPESTTPGDPADNRTGRVNASIYTYNDMCDLHQTLFRTGKGPNQFSENPYTLEVTEITVKGNRLHNHLHLKITSDPGKASAAQATGRIRYAFIVVHDQNGWAVGDFNTGVRCHDDCQCNDPIKCHQGNFNDTIPCMFTSLKSVTHPGMMMFYGGEEGVEEIHATWRFAQSTSKGHFIKQLHFKTLLMEDNKTRTMERDCRVNYRFTNMYSPNTTKQCRRDNQDVPCTPVTRTGKWGWTALYKILWPTFETLGAWDHYPRKFIKEADVACHASISEAHYFVEPYPKYEITDGILQTYEVIKAPNSCEFKSRYKFPRNGEKGSGPRFITGALNSLYSKLSWEKETKLFYGAIQEEYLKEQQIFLHDEYNHRIPYTGDGSEKPPKLNSKFDALPKLTNMLKDERCRCPRMGAPPAEASKRAPPVSQLEGRKDHAIQMTIAWIVLVPFAIFASRYYKETYSKVFFLQEYWWFTLHVLSLLLAAMFMVGGIYAIEIKREERFNNEDPGQVAHAIIGGVALLLFLAQLLFGWTRMKKPEHRRIQIFLHWLFGVAEYVLALIAMLNASIIFAGCMSCWNFGFVLAWLVIQLIFYIIMEIHFRKVDKVLKLNPKRSYLPPPVMRVFHESTPGAKFRIYMLIAYIIACVIAYGFMHYYIEFTPAYHSCWNYDEDFERTIVQFQPDH